MAADDAGADGAAAPGAAGGEEAAAVPAMSDTLRVLLDELERYLEQLPDDAVSESVLPLASTWVLKDAAFDLERYRAEARQFVSITPEQDRMLRSFPKAVTYYMALRLTLSTAEEPEPERARTSLERARAALEDRAALVEDDFPRVARAFRKLLDETAETRPPDDRLWRAMALRIAEPEMPKPGYSS